MRTPTLYDIVLEIAEGSDGGFGVHLGSQDTERLLARRAAVMAGLGFAYAAQSRDDWLRDDTELAKAIKRLTVEGRMIADELVQRGGH